MKTGNLNQFVRSSQVEWAPLVEEGLKTDGVFVKSLRFDEITKRPPTILLKFEAGASYPYHNHPGGEEVFVLEGEIRFAGYHLRAGDYLYTAPGEKHSAYSKTGCIILLVIPEEVEIIKGRQETEANE